MLRLNAIGIPSFIMTLAMMQIADGISAMLVRGQIAYAVPPIVSTLGSGQIFEISSIITLPPSGADRSYCSPTPALDAMFIWSAATVRRRNIPESM